VALSENGKTLVSIDQKNNFIIWNLNQWYKSNKFIEYGEDKG
jgi:hypothetical protein